MVGNRTRVRLARQLGTDPRLTAETNPVSEHL